MGKKVLFGSKTVFLGQKVHYYVVYIAYHTELNLQICNFVQQRRICCKNSKYAPDETFVASSALKERLTNSATLMLRVSDTH